MYGRGVRRRPRRLHCQLFASAWTQSRRPYYMPLPVACGQSEVVMDWQIFEGELDHDDVRALLAQHFTEMQAGSPPEACHVLPIDGLKDPAIRFFTLREDMLLLGCGALKQLASDHGEVKAMRTANSALGRGVGQKLLDQLLKAA